MFFLFLFDAKGKGIELISKGFLISNERQPVEENAEGGV